MTTDKWRQWLKTQSLPRLEEDLLRQAFSHPSYVREQDLPPHLSNQRLEFLGDAILDLIIAEELYRHFPQAPEGELTRRKAALVRKSALAEFARELGLGELLLVGRGEEETGGRQKTSLLADALEALVGALYLAGGAQAAREFILRHFAEALRREAAAEEYDYKTRLQELVQARRPVLPEYATQVVGGPPHDRTFAATVSLAGTRLGEGQGRSKREAEQAAARCALQRQAAWEELLGGAQAQGQADTAR